MILKRKQRRIPFWSWEKERFLKQDRKMLTLKRNVWDIWLQQRKSVHQKVYKNIQTSRNVEKAPTVHRTDPIRVQDMYRDPTDHNTKKSQRKTARIQIQHHTAGETRAADGCGKKRHLATNQRTADEWRLISTHHMSKNLKFDSDTSSQGACTLKVGVHGSRYWGTEPGISLRRYRPRTQELPCPGRVYTPSGTSAYAC